MCLESVGLSDDASDCLLAPVCVERRLVVRRGLDVALRPGPRSDQGISRGEVSKVDDASGPLALRLVQDDGRMRVLIVGGGIAGLSLAIALEPTGADVELIERGSEWTTEGAAITLRPLAVKAIRRLGVLDDVLAAGRVIDRQRFFNLDGDTMFDQMLADEGEVTVVIHRRRLQQLLSERLGRTTVRMGEQPVVVESDGSVVDVTLASGERRRCDLVVGADGIGSWLRRELFPGAVVQPVGQQYWRFCVEGELIEHWCVLGDAHRFVALLPLPGMTYCAAGLTGTSLLDDGVVDPRTALFEIFSHYPSPVSDVLDRVTPATEVHFGPVHEVVLRRWSGGRIGLIGDAAHAFSPILGLGGGLAIEDAVVLGDELRRRPPIAALDAFTDRRQPRVALARQLANERVAAIAGKITIDEDMYRQRLAKLLDDP